MMDLPERDLVESAALWTLEQLKSYKHITGADILYKADISSSLSFIDGDLEDNSRGRVISLGLRVIDKEGRQGIAYCNMLDKEALCKVIEWSVHNCKNNDPNPYVELNRNQSIAFKDQDIFDPFIAEGFDFDQGSKICASVTDEARSIDKRVKSVREAFYGEGYEETLYLSSEGFCEWQKETVARCDVAVIMSDGDEMEMGGFGDERRYASDLDYLDIARQAVYRTRLTLGGKNLKTAKYILVLDSLASASFVSMLEDCFLADNVHKGRSLLSGKLGCKIASDVVNLIDDATLKKGMGSYLFDGEGVPGQRTTLLSRGILNGFLYNIEHANMDGVPSTGNCARGTASLPSVGASNLFISPGTEDLECLLNKAGSGIYVTELLGLHTFDPVSGDFSLGIKGARIERGILKDPVSGMTIAGNIYDVLYRVVGVGKDIKFYGSVGSPSLVIEDVATAGI